MTAKPEDERKRRHFAIGLAAVAALGLVVRVGYAVSQRELALRSDGTHYPAAAAALLAGRGFINPMGGVVGRGEIADAAHPPMWTLVLAGVTKIGFDSVLAYQVVAALVGVATVVMIGLAGREAFGRRVGLIAATIASLYPGLWLYERELVSEPLGMLGVATIVFLAYRFRHRPGPWMAVAMGLVLGIAALTRSELIAVSLLVVTPVILAARGFPIGRRIAWLAMAAVATVAVIAPWFAYNTTRFSQPVPLSVGLGGTMAAGNCSLAYDGELAGYYHGACVFLYKNIDPDPSVADGQYRKIALDYMNAHRGDAVRVAAIRIGRTFGVYSPFQQRELESERGTTMWVLTTALWSYWSLVPFAVGGIVVARRRVPVYPLLGFFVVSVASVVLTIGAFRYRALAEPSLVILAAVGVNALVRTLRQQCPAAEPVVDLTEPAAVPVPDVAPVP